MTTRWLALVHIKAFNLLNVLTRLSLFFPDTWSTPHMAQALARMAESGRAKVKEVRHNGNKIFVTFSVLGCAPPTPRFLCSR